MLRWISGRQSRYEWPGIQEIKQEIADDGWRKGLAVFIKNKDENFSNKNDDTDYYTGAKHNFSPFFMQFIIDV